MMGLDNSLTPNPTYRWTESVMEFKSFFNRSYIIIIIFCRANENIILH